MRQTIEDMIDGAADELEKLAEESRDLAIEAMRAHGAKPHEITAAMIALELDYERAIDKALADMRTRLPDDLATRH